MTKLLLLDLDGTCRTCRSNPGGFIKEPFDQCVIEGAAEALQCYVDDGWTAVGVTNQGGCMVRETRAADFPVGAYLHHDGVDYKVERKELPDDYVVLHLLSSAPGRNSFASYGHDSIVQYRFKTLKDCIAEQRHTMELLPLMSTVYFCPDSGETCYGVTKAWCGLYSDGSTSPPLSNVAKMDTPGCLLGDFRKPSPGMLLLAIAASKSHPKTAIMPKSGKENFL